MKAHLIVLVSLCVINPQIADRIVLRKNSGMDAQLRIRRSKWLAFLLEINIWMCRKRRWQ